MSRLSLLALVAAASFLRAESPPEYTLPRCPVIDPTLLFPPVDVGEITDPWICVLPPPTECMPYIIGPDGELELHPWDWVIDDSTYKDVWSEWVMDYSDDFDVQLMDTEFLGSKLLRLSTGEEEQLPMVAASELAAPDAITPAVMVELYGNALSGDGNVVIGTAGYSGTPFRYRAWGTGGLELLQVPAETWAGATPVELSRDGDVVVGSAISLEHGNEQAVRWNRAGELIALNPLHGADTGSVARLVTPDGQSIAGDVYSLSGSGIVPFLWNGADGYQQLGDPNASADQVIAQSISDDGLMLAGARYDEAGNYAAWYWTKEEGFKDVEVAICDFEGQEVEDYTLSGIDPVRRVYTGNFQNGEQFISFEGVSISPTAWMSSLAGPISTLRSASAMSSQTMEGAHHRPIKELALPGRNEFAWVTGDVGKSTRERDAVQTAGEIGYGRRLGTSAVLGLAFGYSELKQDYDGTGSGDSNGIFFVVDLGFTAGPGEVTLTALGGHSNISTQRSAPGGSWYGLTEGAAYSFRARYDHALGKVGTSPVGAFASVTLDHSDINSYNETGAAFGASYGDQSNENWIGRLGLTTKLALGAATDVNVTAEVAHTFNENRDDFTGTDISTGVLDFTMTDQRSKTTWGRLGLDIDHRLSDSTVLSLTLHGSTRGDAFDTAAALSLRHGF